jgi:hypothetical protein
VDRRTAYRASNSPVKEEPLEPDTEADRREKALGSAGAQMSRDIRTGIEQAVAAGPQSREAAPQLAEEADEGRRRPRVGGLAFEVELLGVQDQGTHGVLAVEPAPGMPPTAAASKRRS